MSRDWPFLVGLKYAKVCPFSFQYSVLISFLFLSLWTYTLSDSSWTSTFLFSRLCWISAYPACPVCFSSLFMAASTAAAGLSLSCIIISLCGLMIVWLICSWFE